jgi:hypothetical protein
MSQEDEKMDEPVTLRQILENQEIMIQNMDLVLQRLMIVERDVRVLHTRSHETKIYVKRGLAECKEYLKACQKGYHNIAEFSENLLEETEELQNTMASATVSTWS